MLPRRYGMTGRVGLACRTSTGGACIFVLVPIKTKLLALLEGFYGWWCLFPPIVMVEAARLRAAAAATTAAAATVGVTIAHMCAVAAEPCAMAAPYCGPTRRADTGSVGNASPYRADAGLGQEGRQVRRVAHYRPSRGCERVEANDSLQPLTQGLGVRH